MLWLIPLLAVFFLLLVAGMPIAFALGLASMGGIWLLVGPAQLVHFATLSWHYATNFAFICLPLFILMSGFLNYSGIGSNAFSVAEKWFRRVPGSLAVSSIAACAAFSGVSGSSTGTAAAIGAVALPELEKRGYDSGLATGALAAGGTLGILIPPSGLFIIYGILAEVSIAKLFIAGVVPGIMMAVMFCLYIIIRVLLNPNLAPRGDETAVSWGEKLRGLKDILPALMIIVIVIGSLYSGMATPTEVAAIGVIAALLISLPGRQLGWDNMRRAMLTSVRISTMVFFCIFGAMGLAYILAIVQVPQAVAAWVAGTNANWVVLMLLINILFLVLGCFIDPAGCLVITLPIILPIARALGWDMVWLGVVLVLNCECGMITPPVGLNLFVIKGIAPRVNFAKIAWGALPFVLLLGLGIVLIVAFPQLALWLPANMK